MKGRTKGRELIEADSGADRDLWGRGSRSWWRIARRYVRAGRTGEREAHAIMRRRFSGHWATLERETWQPMMLRARQLDAYRWGAGMLYWRHGFLAIVLETAYWWGLEAATEPDRTKQLRAAVDDLRGINSELRDLAGQMADLFERGSELRNRFGIDVDWTEPGPDLWGLLEEVSHWPPYRGTCLDSEALETLLRYMRGTTRPTPGLSDLLNAFSMCEPGEPVALDAADAEALAKAQGTKPDAWPERVRRLFASLADSRHRWRDRNGRTVTMLDCFTAQTLAPLANVAGGFDPFDEGPKALSVKAIEKALQRFRD